MVVVNGVGAGGRVVHLLVHVVSGVGGSARPGRSPGFGLDRQGLVALVDVVEVVVVDVPAVATALEGVALGDGGVGGVGVESHTLLQPGGPAGGPRQLLHVRVVPPVVLVQLLVADHHHRPLLVLDGRDAAGLGWWRAGQVALGAGWGNPHGGRSEHPVAVHVVH